MLLLFVTTITIIVVQALAEVPPPPPAGAANAAAVAAAVAAACCSGASVANEALSPSPAEGVLMLAGYAAATALGLSFRSTPTALRVDSGVSDAASSAVSVRRWTV